MFVASHATERAFTKEASIIGLDLAKRSFQAHGALADGSVAFRKWRRGAARASERGDSRSGDRRYDALLPLLVVELARVYLDQIDRLSEKIAGLEKAIACEAKRGAITRRLQTMPGVGPITAMAIETFAPPMEVFRRGRDFAAWLRLVPIQHSTGGKQVLGKTSKMGQRDIRRLLEPFAF